MLSITNMNNFFKKHIFKIHNFQGQFSTFEPNVLKSIIKSIFISWSPFALLIINVKILFNFKKRMVHIW
jgi:hypothetical protein